MNAQTVLVIDDDRSMRLLAKTTLLHAGFNVLEADSAEAAIPIILGNNTDAILLDVGLPGMDGFEACKTIRLLPHAEHLPIMMLTGLDDIESINRAYEVGATDFATKPMNWQTLAHRLYYIIRSNHTLVELDKSKQRLQNAKKIAEIADWEYEPRLNHLYWSRELYNLLGIDYQDAPKDHSTILKYIHPEDRDAVRVALHDLFTQFKGYELEYRIQSTEYETLHVQEKASILYEKNGDIVSFFGTLQDVSKRKAIEAEVHRLAYYDSLTGLSNRSLFNELLSNSLKRANRMNSRVAVLFIDLDNFKQVNDTLGHDSGDALLQDTARRLQKSLRETDVISRPLQTDSGSVARIGGDEFMVLLTDNVSSHATKVVAARLVKTLKTTINTPKCSILITASIGIAFYPENGQDARTLLKNADIAMYQAKEKGKNSYSVYDAPSSE